MKRNKNKQNMDVTLSDEALALDTDAELIEEKEYADDTVGYEPYERKATGDDLEEEDAPAEQEEREEKGKDPTSLSYLIRMAVVLTCICAVMAGLLAAVNALTKDVIAENRAREKREAILTVFPEGDRVEEYTTASGETVNVVFENNEIIGYTVHVVASGYVGPVDMMVGIDRTGKISGIRIISMEETPGVGTKIRASSFLAQFIGLDRSVVYGENADVISGATFSSQAVAQGVNAALAVFVDFDEIEARLCPAEEETGIDPALCAYGILDGQEAPV